MTQPTRTVPGYWTVAELAAAAGKTPGTIRWHCRQGRLRSVAVATENAWLIPDLEGIAFLQWVLEGRTPDRGRRTR